MQGLVLSKTADVFSSPVVCMGPSGTRKTSEQGRLFTVNLRLISLHLAPTICGIFNNKVLSCNYGGNQGNRKGFSKQSIKTYKIKCHTYILNYCISQYNIIIYIIKIILNTLCFYSVSQEQLIECVLLMFFSSALTKTKCVSTYARL